MSSSKKSSTPKSSTDKAAAKTAKTARKAQHRTAEAASETNTMAAPAAPAEVMPNAAPVGTESPIALHDDLVARVARAIARMDPQCPLPPHEVTDDLQVDPNGAYARMARAALLTR